MYCARLCATMNHIQHEGRGFIFAWGRDTAPDGQVHAWLTTARTPYRKLSLSQPLATAKRPIALRHACMRLSRCWQYGNCGYAGE